MILSSGTTGPTPGGTEYGDTKRWGYNMHGPNKNPRPVTFYARATTASGSEDTWDGATVSLQSKGPSETIWKDHPDTALTADGWAVVYLGFPVDVRYKIVAAGSPAGSLSIELIEVK